jgi:signal peptidase I
MSKSNLYKLRKTELLQIIYEQEQKINNLKEENANLIKELDNRIIDIKEAGSIAEATLRINKIFEDAQKAADEYLNNVKKLNKSKKETEEKITVNNKKMDKNNSYKQSSNLARKELGLIPLNMELINVKISLMQRTKLFLLIILEKVKILKLKREKKKFLNNIKKIGKKEILELQRKERINKLKNKINSLFNKIKAKKDYAKNYIKKIFEILKRENNKFLKTKDKIISKIKVNPHFFIKERKINLDDYDLSLENIENELKKQKNKDSKLKFAKTSTYYIIVIIAITIIAVTKIFNVIQISGNSMENTLYSGDISISTPIFGYKKGDIIAFYYNNSVLIKRVIATGGDIVNIDDEGNVYVNSERLEESYVEKLSYGNCDITFPFKVPEKELFVLGDNRESSIDSRMKAIGSVSEDKIIGKIIIVINRLMFY